MPEDDKEIQMIDSELPARARNLSGDIVDTSPAPEPERVVHTGRFVTLEPLDADRHGDELWEVAGDPAADDSWTYLGYGPWNSKEEYISWIRTQQESIDPLFFAFRDNATGRAVGTGTLMRITPEARCIEVGHLWFSLKLQRTPAATEAIYLLIKHSFDLGYRRMEWKCNALNEPSRRAARRFGFTYEGTFYQHMFAKGRNRDTAWYSILDCEWPAIDAAFRVWLAPENFDENGVQRRALIDLTASLA